MEMALDLLAQFRQTLLPSWHEFLGLIDMENATGWPLYIVIAILVLSFLFLIVTVRTLCLALNLGWIARKIRKQKKSEIQKDLKSEILADLMRRKWYPNRWSKLYPHLWSEYSETLHRYQHAGGSEELRATLPAETFFTRETLVDNRVLVWNDFFRHLPGILTGLGIVGTFSGLINGLEGFAPTEEAGAARESLTHLLGGVKEAFHVSAFAISAAIFVTLFEKALLALAYKNVEKITHALDALYDAGAGEDYLKRLVEAEESNAAQMTQLREALVNDLKTMLTEMTDRQVHAQQASSEHLAQILKEPLDGMAKGLSNVSSAVQGGAQASTDVMKGALDDLMSAFIHRMDETLSTNMSKVADSMERSALTMTAIQQSMDNMISKIADTSSAAVSGMAEKLETAMERAANNQTLMAEQMRELVGSLRDQMSHEQGNSQQAMKDAMDVLLSQIQTASAAGQDVNSKAMTALMERLEQLTNNIGEAQQGSQTRLTGQLDSLFQQIGIAVGKIADTSNAAIGEMTEKLKTTMGHAANNQTVMTEQMRELVANMHNQVTQGRDAHQQATKDAMDELLSHIRTASAAGQDANTQAMTTLMMRLEGFINNIGTTQQGHQAQLTQQFDSLLKQVGIAVTAMESSTKQLQSTTTDAIGGMNRGAENLQRATTDFIGGMNRGTESLRTAATDFTSAGKAVAGVLDKTGPLATQMQNTGLHLSQSGDTMRKASEQLSGMFERYQAVQTTTAGQVALLQQLITSAQGEAAIRGKWIRDLELAAETLRTTEKHSKEHLDSINASLEKAFRAFGNSMTDALKESFASVNGTIEGLNGVAQILADELDQKRR